MMPVSLCCVLMSVCLASTGVLAQSVPPAIFESTVITWLAGLN